MSDNLNADVHPRGIVLGKQNSTDQKLHTHRSYFVKRKGERANNVSFKTNKENDVRGL